MGVSPLTLETFPGVAFGTLGDALGDAFGDALGVAFGDALGDAFGDALRDAFGDALGDAFGDFLGGVFNTFDSFSDSFECFFGEAFSFSVFGERGMASGTHTKGRGVSLE